MPLTVKYSGGQNISLSQYRVQIVRESIHIRKTREVIVKAVTLFETGISGMAEIYKKLLSTIYLFTNLRLIFFRLAKALNVSVY